MAPRLLLHPVPTAPPVTGAFRALHGEETDVFWLDDAEGWSVFGAGERWVPDAPVLDALAVELAGRAGAAAREDSAARPGGASIDGLAWRPGLVGWLGYGVTGETMGLAVDGSGHRDAAFLRVDRAVAVAPDGRMLLIARGEAWEGALARWRDRTLDVLAGPGPEDSTASPARPVRVEWRDAREDYVAKVRRCQEAIARGDAYVLNLTTEAVVEGMGLSPLDVHLRLRASAPTRYGGFLRIGDTSLISSSPESFLEIDRDGGVATRPVKGTRPRASGALADARLRDELAASAKERAENTMIVDLMRNDLARVAEPGSVEVPALLEVESLSQVHQLVSTVRARLRPGVGAVEVLRAAFPAGSMTGAPKRSSVQILDALERRPRGLYSGAFGFLGDDGSARLAMTIRSIVLEGERATVGVGGGVTALSRPEEEWAEVRLKARAPLEALGVPAGG